MKYASDFRSAARNTLKGKWGLAVGADFVAAIFGAASNEAIKKSKEIMSGNRGRLFCLHLSFIGWEILNVFTCGIGSLWLNPYRNAATADFYREITGSRPEEEEGSVEEDAPIEEA